MSELFVLPVFHHQKYGIKLQERWYVYVLLINSH